MFSGDNVFFSSIRSIIKKMHQISDKELKPFGISHAEMRIMILLYATDCIRQEELSFTTGVDRTNVGRSLKRLESLGYITKEKNQEDARTFYVSLTEKGRGIRKKLETIKEYIELLATEAVSPEEVAMVSMVLQRIDENLSCEKYRLLGLRNKPAEQNTGP